MIDFARINRANAMKKVAAMLPRLATEHDGEVVATVRAIERTLKGVDMDWHDLVTLLPVHSDAMTVLDRRNDPAPPRPPSPRWDGFRPTPRQHDSEAWMVNEIESTHDLLAQCSSWEQEFILSLKAQLGSGRRMSDKQRTTLKAIYRKLRKADREADVASAFGLDGDDEV